MRKMKQGVAYSQHKIKLKINYQKQDMINELFPACSYATNNGYSMRH